MGFQWWEQELFPTPPGPDPGLLSSSPWDLGFQEERGNESLWGAAGRVGNCQIFRRDQSGLEEGRMMCGPGLGGRRLGF